MPYTFDETRFLQSTERSSPERAELLRSAVARLFQPLLEQVLSSRNRTSFQEEVSNPRTPTIGGHLLLELSLGQIWDSVVVDVEGLPQTCMNHESIPRVELFYFRSPHGRLSRLLGIQYRRPPPALCDNLDFAGEEECKSWPVDPYPLEKHRREPPRRPTSARKTLKSPQATLPVPHTDRVLPTLYKEDVWCHLSCVKGWSHFEERSSGTSGKCDSPSMKDQIICDAGSVAVKVWLRSRTEAGQFYVRYHSSLTV